MGSLKFPAKEDYVQPPFQRFKNEMAEIWLVPVDFIVKHARQQLCVKRGKETRGKRGGVSDESTVAWTWTPVL